AMQRLSRGLCVMHHGDPDEVRTGIAPVVLVAGGVASGQDFYAGLAPQPCGRRLAAAMSGYVEPEEKPSGGAPIAVAVADDVVGEIEFLPVEFAVGFDVAFVAISRDRDLLG